MKTWKWKTDSQDNFDKLSNHSNFSKIGPNRLPIQRDLH